MDYLVQSISWKDIFSIVTPLLTIGTIVVALCTYLYQKRTKMTDDLFKMMESFYKDEDIRMILNKIDKEPEEAASSKWYKDGKFIDPEDEARIDRLLYTFSYICYMRKKNSISEELFDYIGYYIKVAADDHEIKEYLKYMEDMCHRKNLKPKDSPLYYFQEYVCERENKECIFQLKDDICIGIKIKDLELRRKKEK